MFFKYTEDAAKLTTRYSIYDKNTYKHPLTFLCGILHFSDVSGLFVPVYNYECI